MLGVAEERVNAQCGSKKRNLSVDSGQAHLRDHNHRCCCLCASDTAGLGIALKAKRVKVYKMIQRFQAQWEHENDRKNSTPFNEWLGGSLCYSMCKARSLHPGSRLFFRHSGSRIRRGPGDVENTHDFSGAWNASSPRDRVLVRHLYGDYTLYAHNLYRNGGFSINSIVFVTYFQIRKKMAFFGRF
jgi:hypothetical protein